jgi:hypothetical protein
VEGREKDRVRPINKEGEVKPQENFGKRTYELVKGEDEHCGTQ